MSDRNCSLSVAEGFRTSSSGSSSSRGESGRGMNRLRAFTRLRQRRPFFMRRLFILLCIIASYFIQEAYREKRFEFAFRILYIFYKHAVEHIDSTHRVVFLQSPPAIRTRTQNYTLPNIVFILADDLGFNDIGGGAGVSTPNIDSIFNNGIRFTNAYAGSATCSPSRAAQMTGKYPTQIGWEFTLAPKALSKFAADHHGDIRKVPTPIFHGENYDAAPDIFDAAVPSQFPFSSSLLKEEFGYWNFFFGKWDSGFQPQFSPLARGFDESLAFLLGGSLYLKPNDKRVVNAQGMAMEELMRRIMYFKISHNNTHYFEPDEYMTDYLANHAADLIYSLHSQKLTLSEEERASRPFYISLNFNGVHDPYQALKTDLENDEVRALPTVMEQIYAAMILALDRGVGKVLKALKDTNELDDTIVIFTSDNGAANYVELENLSSPFRGWKCTLFEGGIHVPMALQWNRAFPEGHLVIDTPVMQMDLPATYLSTKHLLSLDLIGDQFFTGLLGREQLTLDKLASLSQYSRELSLRHNFDGTSMWPIIFTELAAQKWPSLRSNVLAPENLPRPLFWRSGYYKALRIGDLKMQVSLHPNKVWFFNLASDPSEWDNLALRFDVHSQSDIDRLSNAVRAGELDREVRRLKLSPVSSALLLTMLNHYQELLRIDGEQQPALWEPVVDLPICVDSSSKKGCSLKDEWVLWPN